MMKNCLENAENVQQKANCVSEQFQNKRSIKEDYFEKFMRKFRGDNKFVEILIL